jgi:multisubunit Na+/H+ antiporter MnhB subunit
MSIPSQTHPKTQFAVSFVPFLVLFVIGLLVVGTSAPFWQILVAAVVAGLIGLVVGRLAKGRLT